MKSVKTALVLITLMLVGIIKEEIKIVFIIIRYQDFLVEFKVGDFFTRDCLSLGDCLCLNIIYLRQLEPVLSQ